MCSADLQLHVAGLLLVGAAMVGVAIVMVYYKGWRLPGDWVLAKVLAFYTSEGYLSIMLLKSVRRVLCSRSVRTFPVLHAEHSTQDIRTCMVRKAVYSSKKGLPAADSTRCWS